MYMLSTRAQECKSKSRPSPTRSALLLPYALRPVFTYVLGWVVTRRQAGGDTRSGGTDSLSKDIVVEGFSITVGGKTLFDNADLRISHGQVCNWGNLPGTSLQLRATCLQLPCNFPQLAYFCGARCLWMQNRQRATICIHVYRATRNVCVLARCNGACCGRCAVSPLPLIDSIACIGCRGHTLPRHLLTHAHEREHLLSETLVDTHD